MSHALQSAKTQLSSLSEERSIWEQLATESDKDKALLAEQLAALQANASAAPLLSSKPLPSLRRRLLHKSNWMKPRPAASSTHSCARLAGRSTPQACATAKAPVRCGKTRTCIALIYRLLKAQRFRRILFLVDRSALSEQAAYSFKDTRMERLQTFVETFGIKELQAQSPDDDTAVHIATVQGMMRRLLSYPAWAHACHGYRHPLNFG